MRLDDESLEAARMVVRDALVVASLRLVDRAELDDVLSLRDMARLADLLGEPHDGPVRDLMPDEAAMLADAALDVLADAETAVADGLEGTEDPPGPWLDRHLERLEAAGRLAGALGR